MSSVELSLCPGADFLEFPLQSSDFCIEFDKTQTLTTHEPLRLHSGIILFASCLQVDASGWLLSSRVAFQVNKIETQSFDHAAIMSPSVSRDIIKLGTGGEEEKPRSSPSGRRPVKRIASEILNPCGERLSDRWSTSAGDSPTTASPSDAGMEGIVSADKLSI